MILTHWKLDLNLFCLLTLSLMEDVFLICVRSIRIDLFTRCQSELIFLVSSSCLAQICIHASGCCRFNFPFTSKPQLVDFENKLMLFFFISTKIKSSAFFLAKCWEISYALNWLTFLNQQVVVTFFVIHTLDDSVSTSIFDVDIFGWVLLVWRLKLLAHAVCVCVSISNLSTDFVGTWHFLNLKERESVFWFSCRKCVCVCV